MKFLQRIWILLVLAAFAAQLQAALPFRCRHKAQQAGKQVIISAMAADTAPHLHGETMACTGNSTSFSLMAQTVPFTVPVHHSVYAAPKDDPSGPEVYASIPNPPPQYR